MNKRLAAATAVAVAAVFSLYLVPSVCLAQEDTGKEYAYGIVSSVSSTELIVKDYDYDKDEEMEVVYALDPGVEVKNAASLQDISAGDGVEIDYVVTNGKRTAKVITVEKASDIYEEQPEAMGVEPEEATAAAPVEKTPEMAPAAMEPAPEEAETAVKTGY
ncbi:MAG: hypothetical protein PHR44_02025 [Candidatus Omnitrophica bacterium]|nr:hypothetical protein [Candidatus Omnitrophota bacterium]